MIISMHTPTGPSPTDPLDPARQHDPVTDPNVNGDINREDDPNDVERPMDPDAPTSDPQVPPPDEPTPLSDDRR
jgi:hypothetical protein